MRQRILKNSLIVCVWILLLTLPVLAFAETSFNQIISFGTSLSDPGNAFVLTGAQSTPPYDTLDPLLIPSAPYAKGGHHFSNGATWIEQFARIVGLAGDANPAFLGTGTNYAVGGARARDDGTNFNLSDQVNMFLADFGGAAPGDALYTIEFGGNDIRDALIAGSDAPSVIAAAVLSITYNIKTLYDSGARKFLVWNAPDIGLTPALLSQGTAVSYYATTLSSEFNEGLDTALDGLAAAFPDIEIKLFNVYDLMHDIVGNPEAYGLDDTSDACVQPERPPFQCKKPDEYLFWDGIHPTKAVHAILAKEADSLLVGP